MGLLTKLFGNKKKRKKPHRRPRKLPAKVLAPVEEIVEQGLLVDTVAIRMSVKNSIILNALQRNVDYRVDEIHDLVRTQAEQLASERERDASHIDRVREEVRKYGRSAWQETEYGNQDSKTLKHRQEVYEALAGELAKLAADDEFVRSTAERARKAAWGEIGDSLKERATHPYYSGGSSPEYLAERDERIETFIAEDLAELLGEEPEPEEKGGLFRRKKAANRRQ